MPSERTCVYTVLFGGYEDILEQPDAERSDLDFICFTDDPDLQSETWQIRVVPPALPEDSQRSSRYPKICAHRFLTEYELSMYIDNSVLLQQPPEITLDTFLPNEQKMGVFGHSFRDTLEEEFNAVLAHGYEYPQMCLELLERYRIMHTDVLTRKPIITRGVAQKAHGPRSRSGHGDLVVLRAPILTTRPAVAACCPGGGRLLPLRR